MASRVRISRIEKVLSKALGDQRTMDPPRSSLPLGSKRASKYSLRNFQLEDEDLLHKQGEPRDSKKISKPNKRDALVSKATDFQTTCADKIMSPDTKRNIPLHDDLDQKIVDPVIENFPSWDHQYSPASFL